MGSGIVVKIAIAPKAGEPMALVESVMALAGQGLEGDRYAMAEGSFNKGKPGKRQVTLMNARFFKEEFPFELTRRNICVGGEVELMWLIGKEFKIGEAVFKGVKYCDPCLRPTKLAKSSFSFKEGFQDVGGLVAEVVESGLITVGSSVVPPPKGY